MWFHCHSDTQSICSNVINVQIQIINQFPYLSQCLPIASAIKIWAGRTAAPWLCLQPTHKPPKKTLPGGEEIIQGDLTIPPTLTEIQKSKALQKSTLPSRQINWRKIWMRLVEKLLWYELEWNLKIIPFRLWTKINK